MYCAAFLGVRATIVLDMAENPTARMVIIPMAPITAYSPAIRFEPYRSSKKSPSEISRRRRIHGITIQYSGVANKYSKELQTPAIPLLKVVVVTPTALSADVPCPKAAKV